MEIISQLVSQEESEAFGHAIWEKSNAIKTIELGVRAWKAGEWVCIGYIEFDGSLRLKDVYKPVRDVDLRSEKEVWTKDVNLWIISIEVVVDTMQMI